VRRNGLSSATRASPTLVSDQWALPWIFLPGPGVGGSQPPGSPISRRGHIGLWAWEGASALSPRTRTALPLRPIETVVREEHVGRKPLPLRALRKTVRTAAEPRPGTPSLGPTVGQLPLSRGGMGGPPVRMRTVTHLHYVVDNHIDVTSPERWSARSWQPAGSAPFGSSRMRWPGRGAPATWVRAGRRESLPEPAGAFWLDSSLHDADDCVWCVQLRESVAHQDRNVPSGRPAAGPWAWWMSVRERVMPPVAAAMFRLLWWQACGERSVSHLGTGQGPARRATSAADGVPVPASGTVSRGAVRRAADQPELRRGRRRVRRRQRSVCPPVQTLQ
jgi:hypothetical protein